MREIRVAVLGASGWMGKVHTMAYQTFPHFFGTGGGTARVVALVETNPQAAKDLAFRAPGARILQDWEAAVTDPEIDLIDICLPDSLHYDVAKAALLAGKHVYCEKPLADTADEARELADIAREKGVITRVGHAFPRNPVHDLAKEIITSGEIGEITLFKGCQHIDTFSDPMAPFMWRADRDRGGHRQPCLQLHGVPRGPGLGPDLRCLHRHGHPPPAQRHGRTRASHEPGRRQHPLPLCQWRARRRRFQPHRHGSQVCPELRSLRHKGQPALRLRRGEPPALLHERGPRRPPGFPRDRRRPGARDLWRVPAAAELRAGVQRKQDHRGGGGRPLRRLRAADVAHL
ncbi:Gfo/Idh/MocA family oxidoreductase [Sagittula sp. M10.9X]|uniref:Gfo/Idh/MocA family oxidoreductase n=1 Tax=Sagittula salina TaxID=2820268 RepID=A0A940S475_9RHOB|nr:Gfo/Idh/MocA family oxidoreductase [Sagittula salina]